MIGSSMTFLGLLTSSFVTSPTHLIYTFSVLIGIGIGMLNPAAFVAVLSCFTHQRIHAISLGFAALGLGQMIMPIVVKRLIADYGYESTILIISGLSLLGLIGGNFLVAVKWEPCIRIDAEMQPLVVDTNIGKPTVILREIIQATDLDLLGNLKYIVIIFGLCIIYASSSNLNTIFHVYLQVSTMTK
jgi:MFS family permease